MSTSPGGHRATASRADRGRNRPPLSRGTDRDARRQRHRGRDVRAPLTRVHPDGSVETIAEVPGGPNGAAIGPDGAVYLCNNGGVFRPAEFGDLLLPGGFDASAYMGGRIQRVDLGDGSVTDLYTECDGRPLRAPNDLVMDGHGGFYFTDHGIRDHGANGGVTAISPDGQSIEHHATDDLITTNICFGGDDLRTAYITCSSTGRLVTTRWPRPGLRLAHL